MAQKKPTTTPAAAQGAAGSAGPEAAPAPAPSDDRSPTSALFHEFRAGAELLGRELLPEVVDLGLENVAGDVLLRQVVAIAGITDEDWNGLPAGIRAAAVTAQLALAQRFADHVGEIRRLVAPALDQELVAITAKSKDGLPFRRAGQVFGAEFETVHVTPEAAEQIRTDPSITIQKASA